MAEPIICEECGRPVPGNAPQGLCPGCLAAMGVSLGPEADETGGADFSGRWIGRYQLVDKLGEGGGGVVYRAVQEQPVRREVALKVLKPGMDSRAVIARFEAERQALALMNHPHIAKVFDAGETPEGRPFFAMELAAGRPITTFCLEHALEQDQRLELFILVCQAIQHAHQKGIIHRDIKPSNVLVGLVDGIPTPRVIDFGIAKAVEKRLTTETLTQEHHFLGTPAYMSPEQATLGGQDIDTRSDIYSLGILLYELLTGTTPFDDTRWRGAAFELFLKTIRETEAEKPSVRLQRHRATARDPVLGASTVDPDLDWIVLKSLEKDRARRYDTAADFAADVRRYLDHQPILARPPTTIYQVRKFARRHRGPVLAGSAIFFVLVGGLLVSSWLAMRATRAEREQNKLYLQAERAREGEVRAREKSDQVAQFLERMLKGVGPSVALGRDTKLLREILDRTAAGLKSELSAQPEVEADLRGTIGDVYAALGLLEPAEAMLRESLRLREALLKPDHVEIAASLEQLANVLISREKSDEAIKLHRRALQIFRDHYGPVHRQVAATLNNLGNALIAHDLPEAEKTLRESLEINRQLHPDSPPSPSILYSLGLVLKDRGKLNEAEKFLRESLEIRRKQLNAIHPDFALSLSSLGDLLRDLGRLDEAETNLVEAVAVQRKVHEGPHPGLAAALGNLSLLLDRRQRFEEAEALCRESVDIYRRLGNQELKLAMALSNHALIRGHRGAVAEAERLFVEALEMHKKVMGSGHQHQVLMLNNLGATQRRLGKFKEAEERLRESIAMARKFPGAADRDRIDALRALASMILSRDASGAAEAMVEALKLQRSRFPKTSRTLEMSIYETADVLHRANKFSEAEPLFREAMMKRRDRLPADDDLVITAAAGLGRLLADWAWNERPAFSNLTAAVKGGTMSDGLRRAREGEELLDKCVAVVRNKAGVPTGRRADLQSRWAGAIVALVVNDPNLTTQARLERFAQAEKELLEASKDLASGSAADGRLRGATLERLDRLYAAWETVAPGSRKAKP